MQGFPGIFCYILGVKVTDLVSLNIEEKERKIDGALRDMRPVYYGEKKTRKMCFLFFREIHVHN